MKDEEEGRGVTDEEDGRRRSGGIVVRGTSVTRMCCGGGRGSFYMCRQEQYRHPDSDRRLEDEVTGAPRVGG